MRIVIGDTNEFELMMYRPRKRFGQNFLQDSLVISDIINAINPQTDQHFVEIGPGKGALTDELTQSQSLDIIELDRDLVGLLENKYRNNSIVRIHSGDALNFDFNKLQANEGKLRVVGNLPYNISTPLLFRLMEYGHLIEDMHFMLQKEVVNRICAWPGSKRYGKLSVMIQYHSRVNKLFEVPPDCFEPIPKVTSAMVRLVPFLTPPFKIASQQAFTQVVSQAFNQRRKTLRNALKNLLSEQQIRDLGIDPQARAETLTLEDFARLSKQIKMTEL